MRRIVVAGIGFEHLVVGANRVFETPEARQRIAFVIQGGGRFCVFQRAHSVFVLTLAILGCRAPIRARKNFRSVGEVTALVGALRRLIGG